MLFLPVTRPWAIEPVVDAFDASDVPKSVILYLDAPGCEGWIDAFESRGWAVETYRSGNPAPPEGRVIRRGRHLLMRRRSQEISRERKGPILYSEDDTLVPPQTWGPLMRLLKRWRCTAASGVQYARWGCHIPGTWVYDESSHIYEPHIETRVYHADAVGHYCLLTDAQTYANTPIDTNEFSPVDLAHTKNFACILVDPAVRCKHLLEDGTVIE